MKTKLFLSFGLAAMMLLPGCQYEKKTVAGDYSKTKQFSLLTKSSSSEECECDCEQAPEKARKAKYPAFRKNKVKNAVNYNQQINGGNVEYTTLKLGEFRADEACMKFYATLAKNGLVSVSSKAVMDKFGNYSTWINTSLTDLGKTYVYSGEWTDITQPVGPDDYLEFFNPLKIRDQYGDKIEDDDISDNVNTLLTSFFTQYIADQNKAMELFAESELYEAYFRMQRADSYCKELGIASPIQENVFTGGVKVTNAGFDFYRIPKYENTYKVEFDGGQVLVILDANESTIFDVVINEAKNETFKTVNKNYPNDRIKALYEFVKKKKENPKEVKDSPDYYAPGLIAREWTATGLVLADRGDEYIYDKTVKNAIAYCVPVRLYNNVIDKIYKVTRYAEDADPEEFGSEPEFYAEVDVVLKKENITPFQFIMQNFRLVEFVNEQNLYTVKEISLKYYKDCGWNL